MTADNPYSAPTTEAAADTTARQQQQEAVPLSTLAKQTFLAWEKMRLLYNGVLVVFTLAMAMLAFGPQLWQIGQLWMLCIGGAVVVNLCYFAGPIVDTYISWLGFRSKGLRWTLFILGILSAAFLAFVGILALSFSAWLPNQ